jgi:hypothetical protein
MMILIPVTRAAASTALFILIELPVRMGLARGVETRNQVLAASAWQTGQMRPHRRILENSIDWGNFTTVEGNKFHPFTTDNLQLSVIPS